MYIYIYIRTLHVYIFTYTHTHNQLKKDKSEWHLECGMDRNEFSTVKKRVDQWIQDCHDEYDLEITITSDVRVENDQTIFTSMDYGIEKPFKKGDKMRFDKHKSTIYGEIVHFSCREKFAEDRYSRPENKAKMNPSKALIWYKRLPEEIFKEELFSEEVGPKLRRPLESECVCVVRVCVCVCVCVYGS
jgi:hypothetical protein